MKTLLALLLVLAAGIGAAHQVTDGFRALTTEGARRLAIEERPKSLPATIIRYESGAPLPLAQALHDDGRVTIVAFIYTRCNAVCSVIGSEFQQMQDVLRTRGLDKTVRLLSISFDAGDGQPELAAYAARMRAQHDTWRFARVEDARQRQDLLDTFGITVIPAPLGEFQHNAAFHIVTPDGKLVRIVDYDQPEAALEYSLAASKEKVWVRMGDAS